MNILAESFAKLYDINFKKITQSYSGNEIPLFRAMSDSLLSVSTSNGFDVEEYHGSSNQVRYVGDNTTSRLKARCELSDLMIVVFSEQTKEVRVTYLQAKSERSKVTPNLYAKFNANFEQWHLLSKRPDIVGLGSFNPPIDLLSSAVLPSIGSFAFFYKNQSNEFETFYASADNLYPVSLTKSMKGKLGLVSKSYLRNLNDHHECIASVNNYYFAYHLFNLTIGSPISSNIPEMREIRNWLCMNLKSKVASASSSERGTILAEKLIDTLEPDNFSSIDGGFGAKDLIILKSAYESNDKPAHAFRSDNKI